MSYLYKSGLLLIFVLLFVSCTKKEDYSAYFSGQVVNPHSRYVLFSKGNNVIDTLKLDKNNRFYIKFDSLTPGLYSFKHDPEYQYVYFDKNDSLMVTVNTEDFDHSVTFTGHGDRKNNFMMELYMRHEIDRHKGYDSYNFEYPQFSKTIDSAYALRRSFYEKNKKDIKWSKGFDLYAKTRLDLNYYTKKEYYPYIHARRTGENIIPTLPANYYNFRKNINLNDPSFTGFSPFTRYLTAMINNIAITRNFKGTNVEEDALRDNIDKLNISDSIFGHKKVKDEMLNTIAFNYLLEDQNIINNQKFLERYMQLSTDKNNEIAKIGKAIKNLHSGGKLPYVDLVDCNNKDFYIDKDVTKETVIFFWTSCATAHINRIYQKVAELKAQFPNVNFIAVNVDSDAEWKKMLSQYKLDDALQLRATNFNKLKEKWVITKINRTIILNANGTIKNAFTNLLDEKFAESLL
jgi:hypothetical protein